MCKHFEKNGQKSYKNFCLIHIAIIILSHILYLLYLCPCLDLGLFMSHLCDLCFIFVLISIVINHITSFKQTCSVFCTLFTMSPIFLDSNGVEERE